jgi:hypothetical protein
MRLANPAHYQAVIISVEGSIEKYGRRRPGDPKRHLNIPIAVVESKAGHMLNKYVEMSYLSENPIARILNRNPDPEPPKASRRLMTVTMAAPIFLFAILCISKLSRCGHQPVPRRERMARAAAEERAGQLEAFVGGLTSFTFNKLSQQPDAELLAEVCGLLYSIIFFALC